MRILSLLAIAVFAGCGGTTPSTSLQGGRLLPCPPKPHCVSTDAAEPDDRRMAPIAFSDAPARAQRRVVDALRAEPRAQVVEETGGYVRIAIPTRVFRFVDDVELLVDSTTRRIHFRSSARFGYNDWGVNRARMQRVVARLTETR